jgi:acyl carrier protein
MTVEEVFANVFQLDVLEVDDSLSRERIQQWDSMAHLTLITELERAFRVSISIADAIELTSVGRAKDILKRYGASC